MQRHEASRFEVRDSGVIDEGALQGWLGHSDSGALPELDLSLSLPLLGTLLEVVDASVFVLTRDGQVIVANERGRSLLESHNEAIRPLLHQAISAPNVSTTREVTVAALGALRIWRRNFAVAERGLHALVMVEPKAPVETTLDGALENAARVWGLTSRQKEVFRHVLEGWSNKEIASNLRMARRTVEVHISAVLDKADVESRARLIARTWELGRLGRVRT